MKPTPESLAALRQSSDLIAAVCDRAAWADELEARVERLELLTNNLSASRDHLRDTLDRCQDGGKELRREVSRLTADNQRLGVDVIRLTGELGEAKADLDRARAENGRQAATIAAMRADAAKSEQMVATANFLASLSDKDLLAVATFAATPPAPLRLEVGKTYVRRDGRLETIFTCGAGRDWPYEATSGLRYAPDGGFSFFRDQEHHADLVALAPTVDPASPHP